MSKELLDALRIEEQNLIARLQEVEVLQQRLVAIRGTMALYADNPSSASASSVVAVVAPKGPRSGSTSAVVQDAAEQYLRKIGRRAQTGEIVDELMRLGITAGNHGDRASMVGTVSSYLSAAKGRFDHQRNEGYGLVEWSAVTANQLREIGAIPAHAIVVGEGQTADPIEEPAA